MGAIEAKPSTSARAFCADDEKNIELAISEANEDECKPSYWLQCVTIAKRSIKDGRFDRFSGHQLFTASFLMVLTSLLWFQKASPKHMKTLEDATDVQGLPSLQHAVLVALHISVGKDHAHQGEGLQDVSHLGLLLGAVSGGSALGHHHPSYGCHRGLLHDRHHAHIHAQHGLFHSQHSRVDWLGQVPVLHDLH